MKSLSNKIVFGLIASCLVIFGAVSFVQAENLPKLTEVGCFDDGLYSFQSVNVAVGPKNQVYLPGGEIEFSGEITNSNKYPVVDGYLFVRISKENADYTNDGFNIVDEILPLSGLNIAAAKAVPVKFVWKIPAGLGAGNYRADYFFSVGKKFNLGGLPFTNEITAGFSQFKIDGQQKTMFFLDRDMTKLNGLKYNHIGNIPEIAFGKNVDIIQPIKNLTNKNIEVEVEYSLYYWDSLNSSDLISSKKDKISVPASNSVNLNYKIEKAEKSVYLLKIKTSYLGATSTVNVRFSTLDATSTRLNYPAITAFPIEKDQEFKIFSCFHNVSGNTPAVQVALSLEDESGRNIFADTFTGDLSVGMKAVASAVSFNKDYSFVRLVAKISDKDGKILDQYSVDYDCNNLNSDACIALINQEAKNKLINTIVVALILTVLLALVALVSRRNPRLKKTFYTLAVIMGLIAIILVVWTYVLRAEMSSAQPYTQDPANYRSNTSSDTFSYGWSWDIPVQSRLAGSAVASRQVQGQLYGTTTLQIGQKIKIDTNSVCTFNHTGGAWDTPYCGQTSTQNDYYNTGDNESKLKILDPGHTTSLTVGNGSVLSCTLIKSDDISPYLTGGAKDYYSYECTALAAGSTAITAAVPAISTSFKACNEVSSAAGSVKVTGNNSTNTDPACQKNGNNTNDTYINRQGPLGGYGLANTSVNFSAYSMSWNVNVVAPSADNLSVSCDVNPKSAAVGESVTWSTSVTGGTGATSYSWIGDEGLSGSNSSVTKTYSSVGTKHATSTVTRGAQTLSVNCPGTVTYNNDGGTNNDSNSSNNSNNGVVINPSADNYIGVCSSSIPKRCISGDFEDLEDTTTQYRWSCLGSNNNVTTDDDLSCYASKDIIDDPSVEYACELKMVNAPTNNQIQINKETQ